jgi:hypothetical protein
MELTMIKCHIGYLFLGLVCLSLVACGSLVSEGQGASAISQAEVVETATVAVDESDPPATSTLTSTPEAALVEMEVVTPTATTDMASFTEDLPETEHVSEEPVYAQKMGETVALPACYDFDDGMSVVPPDEACDFSLLPGPDSGTIEVYPQAGAQLAYGGVFPGAPTLAQCAGSDAFSGEREIVAPMAAMYVCYQTDQGRIGYLHFTAADLEQAGTLTFDWFTFIPEASDATVEDEGALTYRNENFGFQLTLPPAWKGYQTTEHTAGYRPDAGSVCFTFDGHMPICVLKIDIWTKTAWAAQDWVPDGYYLLENETHVFAAGPYQSGCIQLDDFQCERRQEVPAILAGLRVETSK